MKAQKFFRRWQRQYRMLFKKQWTFLLRSRDEGNAGQVHDLRVTVRRLRLMLRISAPMLDKKAVKEYETWSRRLLNSTSRLRDYDVALEWLGQQSDCAGAIRSIKRARQRLWKRAKMKMKELPAPVCSRLARFELHHRGKARIERRFSKQLIHLEESVARGLPEMSSLNMDERHALRKKLRRIRYLQEISLPRRKRAGNRLLKKIGRLQNAMGELQNLVNAAAILSRVSSRIVPISIRVLLSQQQSAREDEIRRYSRAWSADRRPRSSVPAGPTPEPSPERENHGATDSRID